MRPVAERFSEWASPSITFFAITDILAVVQLEVGCLSSCNLSMLLHLHLPASRDFVNRSYLLAYMTSPPDDGWFVEMPRLVALRFGGETASAPGCLCTGTGSLCRLCYVAWP